MRLPLRLFWLLSFPLEAAVGWLVIDPSPLKVAVAFVLHVVAAGVFGFSLVIRSDGRDNWAWSLLGWTLSLVVFPLLGMLAVTVAFLLARSNLWRNREAVSEIQVAVEPDRVKDIAVQAQEVEISLLEEREIEPVVDVLQEDDPEAKRAAIEALTKRGGAETVRLLRGLLHDPSPQARLFASLALSRLEDEIGQTILASQRDLEANPGSTEARERLAQLYLGYTMSGFLEGTARDYYLELAREAFESALEESPDPDRLKLQLARTHLMLGNIVDASLLLDELAQKNPADADVHLARMEVIYAFGDFRELSIYAERARSGLESNAAPGDATTRELIEWWAQMDRASGAV